MPLFSPIHRNFYLFITVYGRGFSRTFRFRITHLFRVGSVLYIPEGHLDYFVLDGCSRGSGVLHVDLPTPRVESSHIRRYIRHI